MNGSPPILDYATPGGYSPAKSLVEPAAAPIAYPLPEPPVPFLVAVGTVVLIPALITVGVIAALYYYTVVPRH